jgi:hypothetical protein
MSNEFLFCVENYNDLLNRIMVYDLADFGEKPVPMSFIDMGSFTPQPQFFQPKTIKTSSSMEALLFVADTDRVLVLDISDIRNNNTDIISTINSTATQTSDQWYDLAISDMTLFIFSDTANSIEEWDMQMIKTPVKLRDYPVYDKDINAKPGTYDYDAYNDLFFMTANNSQEMGGNDEYFMVYQGKDTTNSALLYLQTVSNATTDF